MEIERKFLVPEPPPHLDHFPSSRTGRASGAIDPAGTELRIRRRAAATTLTIKGGRGRSRAEEEIEIDSDRFSRLWELSGVRCLEKTRYELPATGGLTIELDVYAGRLAGLVVAEI